MDTPKKKLNLEIVRTDEGSSFRFIHNRLPHFNFPWHYHQELELSLVLKGNGLRIVGDSIEEFQEDDLCFFGPKTPHTWYSKKGSLHEVSSLVIQFSEEFLERIIMRLPEFQTFNSILQISKRGLLITGEPQAKIKELMLKIKEEPSDSPLRLSYLVQILATICTGKSFRSLATEAYELPLNKKFDKKVLTICNLVHSNLHSPLTQNWVASQINMSSASFSRYFKKIFGKSYVEYINELRIGMACRMLFEDREKSITEIAHSLGFNNLTNFNRLFKRYKLMTPRDYRDQVKGIEKEK